MTLNRQKPSRNRNLVNLKSRNKHDRSDRDKPSRNGNNTLITLSRGTLMIGENHHGTETLIRLLRDDGPSI